MKVVICWEEPVGVQLLRTALEQRGCEVQTALLAEDMPSVIAFHHPDVLISSTTMRASFSIARRATYGRARLIALTVSNSISHNRRVDAFCSPALDNIQRIAAAVIA